MAHSQPFVRGLGLAGVKCPKSTSLSSPRRDGCDVTRAHPFQLGRLTLAFLFGDFAFEHKTNYSLRSYLSPQTITTWRASPVATDERRHHSARPENSARSSSKLRELRSKTSSRGKSLGRARIKRSEARALLRKSFLWLRRYRKRGGLCVSRLRRLHLDPLLPRSAHLARRLATRPALSTSFASCLDNNRRGFKFR